ncbi:hypothetical protein D9758_008230 [Tetrapyrgos nigripes]|uniref:Uncharacterized protein n=1 Tax=Tetrapyrgos nigripes TaxID=182062 RepID=A0A8H5LGR0_9AGAR|nr:hypothetical protein D9758_008230 [Tetrapyrgos nigripes]
MDFMGTKPSTSLNDSSLLFTNLRPPSSAGTISGARLNNHTHNFLQHLCRYDDETFVFNVSKDTFTGCRRAEWLFYWARSVSSTENIISSWRSLLESDDIWLQWVDGDEESLRALPSPPACTISSYGWRIASAIISRRLKSQECDRATQLNTTCPQQSVNAPIEIRMAAIAWLARTCTERVMGSKTIPALVLEWWYNMPYWLQNKLPTSTDLTAWQRFSAEMTRENHTCHVERDNQDKWRAWVTVQALLYPSRRLEAMSVSSKGTRCQRCIQSPGRQPKQPVRKIPNHILLLQYIRHVVRGFLQDTVQNYSDEPWIHQFFGGRFRWKMPFTTAVLAQVDDWIQTELISRNDDLKVPLDWIELATASSSELANQQDVLEIENELALMSRDDSSSDSLDIRAWISAIVLSSMTVALGTERSAARAFVQFIQLGDFKFLLDCAPRSPVTNGMISFRDAVQKSGHTCWSTYSADLYSSAYALLSGQKDLSHNVVGCRSKRIQKYYRRVDWHFTERECVSCRDTDILHDLGETIDRGPLRSARSPEDLMEELNDVRDRNGLRLLVEPMTSEDIAALMQRLIGLAQLFEVPYSALPAAAPNSGTEEPQIEHPTSDAEDTDDASSEVTCKQYDKDEDMTGTPPLSPWSAPNPVSRNDETATLITTDGDYATAITREITYGSTLQVFRYSSERESLNAECIPTPKTRSKTDMIEAIKDHLLRLLEANDVQIDKVRGNPKLPWRTLPHILRENGLVFDNWPVGVPQPRDGNGINKVPLKDITAIYETILRKDKTLGIRPVRDSNGRKPLHVLMEDVKPAVRGQDVIVRRNSVSFCLEEGSRTGYGKLKRKRVEEDTVSNI